MAPAPTGFPAGNQISRASLPLLQCTTASSFWSMPIDLARGTIEHGAIAFAHEMDRECATRKQAIDICDVFRLVTRQPLIRKNRIAEAFQLAFDDFPVLPSVVAAFGRDRRSACPVPVGCRDHSCCRRPLRSFRPPTP